MGPFLYCLLRQDLHIFTVYIWITLRLFQAVDAHSGYDFPWSLRHWFPMWAGADHHDYHHQTSVNCFSTSFRHWDYWLGTDSKVCFCSYVSCTRRGYTWGDGPRSQTWRGSMGELGACWRVGTARPMSNEQQEE